MEDNKNQRLVMPTSQELCGQEEIDRGMADEAHRTQHTFGITIAIMQGLMICSSIFTEGGPFASPIRAVYFCLYWMLLAATLVGSRLSRKARQKSPRAQLRIQWIYCAIICAWACGISVLDSHQGSGLVVFCYILPTVGALGMLPPRWAASIFTGAWVVLNVLVGITPEGQANMFSNLINSGFALVVAIFIARQLYMTRCVALNSRAQVERLAVTDQLTGLYNRRFMDETLSARLEEAAKANRPIAGMMVDIDYFKAFNDQFGHLAGDTCLKQITHLMLEQAERDKGFYPVRYGGEEFFICWLDCTAEQARQWAEDFRKKAAALRIPREDGGESQVTVSIGLCAGVSGEKLYDLISRVDAALYIAKTDGRDLLYVAAPEEP